MLIVHGGVRVAPDRVAEVAEQAAPFEQLCRAEDGCVQYVLAFRVDDPARIQLLEVWATKEAWEAHKQQPHVLEWTRFIGGAAAGPPEFTTIEADG